MCQIWVQRSHFFRLVGFCWVFHYKSIVSSQYNHSHFHWFIFICSLEVSSAASSVSAASSASVSDQHQHILQHKQQHQNNLKHLPLCSFAYHQQYHQYWLVAQLDDLCIYHWFFVLIISASYQQRDWVQQCTTSIPASASVSLSAAQQYQNQYFLTFSAAISSASASAFLQ